MSAHLIICTGENNPKIYLDKDDSSISGYFKKYKYEIDENEFIYFVINGEKKYLIDLIFNRKNSMTKYHHIFMDNNKYNYKKNNILSSEIIN